MSNTREVGAKDVIKVSFLRKDRNKSYALCLSKVQVDSIFYLQKS